MAAFNATVRVVSIVEVPLKAGTLEAAVKEAGQLAPIDAIRSQGPKTGIVDWGLSVLAVSSTEQWNTAD